MNDPTERPRYELAIALRVYGSPAPQGSKAFKGFRMGKNGRPIGNLQESSKKVKPWRADVKAACEALFGQSGRDAPIDGPIAVEMVFTLPKPTAAPKRRRTWPDKKPDLSKLARSTEDALSDAGVWRDDARVVEYLRLAKAFPGEDRDALTSPGVVIRVYRVLAWSP